MVKGVAVIIFLFLAVGSVSGQKIVYSEPDKSDFRQMDFEILGKVKGNLLIFKNNRNDYSIAVFDMDMKQKDKSKLDFLPDRIINPDFVSYSDFVYMFYQYQKRNIIYAMAAKLDENGKIVGEPQTIDTTEIGYFSNNKIYSLINSDDKQYISVFKINSKHEDNFIVTTLLFNKSLEKLEKVQLNIPMPDRNDYLTEFQVNNNGDFAFLRPVQRSDREKINKLFFLNKRKGQDTIHTSEVSLDKKILDDVRMKPDNYSNSFIIASLYSTSRNGNNDGLYTGIFDVGADSVRNSNFMEFDESLKNEAKGDNSLKGAFNDYFIKNIIVRKDGGFLLAAEALFTTGRGGYNRYDYMYGSPFLTPMDYYMFSPYGYGYPWYRYGSPGQTLRYNAQDIGVWSFDATGKMTWVNIIQKTQYDDETDATIGYSLLNTGDQLHFLFNQQERRTMLLTDHSISPSGQVTRNPTMRSLSTGYDILARYGKQTGARQMIFPCLYRNYLCFARLDL